MTELVYKGTIQQRNGTAAQWTASNRVLLSGEMGLELDTSRMKWGDGSTPWNSLSYITGAEGAVDYAVFDEKRKYISAGVFAATVPEFTDNGDGTCNISGTEVLLFSSTDFTGNLEKYSVPAATNLGPFNGTGKYVCVSYNGGSPIYVVLEEGGINNSNNFHLFQCWWDGTYLHSINFDSQGIGLPCKIAESIYHTKRYIRKDEFGLMLSESATRVINVSSATVYAGVTPTPIPTFKSDVVDNILTHAYYNGSAWLYDRTLTQYKNTEYNPLTGVATLSNGKFAVLWVYRSIGDVKETFYVMGAAQYVNAADANLEKKRSDIPALLREHCMLVGRIIFQKSLDVASDIQSAFDTSFQSSSVFMHNDSAGLQGGVDGERYHQTAIQNASVDSIGNLVVPKTRGQGIKVDTVSPTFGWKDLVADIVIRDTTSPQNPAHNIFRGGLRNYQFSVNDECFIMFHLPHDHVPGTDIFIHAHWASASAGITSGGVTWGFEAMYAKGHNQAPFGVPVTTSIQQNASTTQYQHMIAEVQLSAASPSGSQLDSDDLEVDGLLEVRCFLQANTINGTPEPYLKCVDIHYQSTNMTTKNKAPNFYT